MKPLEALAWDASFMVTPTSANDPLQPVQIGYVQPADSPDGNADLAPAGFRISRENRRVPFVFIEANISPRHRRDLVPVMRVGPLGLFTDRAVPESIQRGVERCIRNKAAQMPGGAFLLGGQPVTLGGREDLVRYLEAKDREREEANARVRADNQAKFTEGERQYEVMPGFLDDRQLLGGRYTDMAYFSQKPAPGAAGPESLFESLAKQAAGILAQGRVPLVYAPADTPKNALANFTPVARLGAWGVWAAPGVSADDVRRIEQRYVTAFAAEAFQEKAYRLAVDGFGGADALRQLVAGTPERARVASRVVVTTRARDGERHGPPLPGSQVGGRPPGLHDDGRWDPPIPKPIYSKPGDLPTWTPLSAEDKAKHAKDQAEFNQRMNAKLRKIEELKKQRAKEDAERTKNNLKIMAAWIEEKKAEQEALNERMIAKLRAAENQPNAATVEIDESSGDPRLIWTNHTDVVLFIEFTFTGTVDGVSIGERQGWTLAMSGRSYVSEAMEGLVALKGKKYTVQITGIRWWARAQDNQWRH